MTEKRFYYNTFYHADDMSRVMEYEIIDRQSYPDYPNHDEKEDIPQWYIYIGENDSDWQDMLVDLLNDLHEENQVYKKKIDIMADAFAQSTDLIEIEQVFYTKVYEPSEYYDEQTISKITNALLGSDVE